MSMLNTSPEIVQEIVDEKALPVDNLAQKPALFGNTAPGAIGLMAATLALAACGGGGVEVASPSPIASNPPTPPPPTAAMVRPTAKQASRFLQLGTMGATQSEITALQTTTPAAWLDEQVAIPRSTSHWQWLIDNNYGTEADKNNRAAFDYTIWRKLISSPDALRQRMTFALSQILVVGLDGLNNSYSVFSLANYVDILERNAFGNFRTLLEEASLSPAMGIYLSHRGNKKADAAGRLPDENYAREIMQLFTIGLYELNNDGTQKILANQPIETYDQADVSNLARVFTGWDFARITGVPTEINDRDRQALPMVLNAANHSPEAKSFLSANIGANVSGTDSLKIALDTLFNHPNVGPFIGKQLIQRLVTSNPSGTYVNRVANAFNNTGGVRGDLKATLKAVLLDDEALNPPAGNSGKLMEPVLRFTQWARAFGLTSSTNFWAGNTSDPATRLGQSPFRSTSVFNFFRPGYVPPSTTFAARGWVVPELQIIHETSVAGYVNYMQTVVSGGNTNMTPNYDSWLTKVDSIDTLLADLNLVLAANRLGSATLDTIRSAALSIPTTSDAGKKNRLYTAILLMLASPEFIST